MMPSGHKAFLVSNVKDVELLLMHNKTYAAEYVTFPCEHEANPAMAEFGGRLVTRGSARLTCSLQDRPQRLLEEAGRHHRAGEAIRCEGHQREGEGHDGGLNDGRQSWGNFFLCFGASQAVLGKGLLFVCGFLAPTRASEYNCSLLRHGQKRAAAGLGFPGFSLRGVGREMFLGPSGKNINEPHAGDGAPGGLQWLGMVGMGIRENISPCSSPGEGLRHRYRGEEFQSVPRAPKMWCHFA